MRTLQGHASGRRLRAPVAVDLRDDALVAVQLCGTASPARVGIADLRPGPAPEIPDREYLARAFTGLWAQGSFKGTRLSLALNGRGTAVRTLRLPRMRRRELARAVALQAQEMLPVPLTELLLDWDAVPDGASRDGPRRLAVVVAAAERRLVHLAVAAAADAGLDVATVSLGPLALAHATSAPSVFDDPLSASTLRAVVDVGQAASTIVVVRAGIPELTTIAAIDDRIPPGAAGCEEGPLPSHLTWPRDESPAEGSVDVLANGLARVLIDCEETITSRLGDVILCGRGADAPGLAASLARLLDIPVSLYSSAPVLPLGAVGLTHEQLQHLSPRLAGALELALLWER